MTMPRQRVEAVSENVPTSTSARTRISLASDVDADRTLLRALHRSGIVGATGLNCLAAVNELLDVIRAAHGRGHLDLRLVPSLTVVRIELDVTSHFASLAQWLSQPADFPAARWGTLHDNRRTLLWADIDCIMFDPVDPDAPGIGREYAGTSDPVEVLLDVTSRLASARSLGDVARVVGGPLRDHLGADTADVAVRDGLDVRLVRAASSEGKLVSTSIRAVGFQAAHDGPIAASARDGKFRGYATARLVDREFPGAAAYYRATHTQALAAVPLTVASRPIGAIAVGWRGARPIDRLRPLLTIVAKHTADATVRVTSPRPEGQATSRSGSRAPDHVVNVAEAAAGAIRLDLVTRSAIVAGRAEPVRLTGREFELLLFLVQNSGTIQSRHDTLREVWGIDFRADTSVVDVTISRLRRKLGTRVIVTVRDQGYLFPA